MKNAITIKSPTIKKVFSLLIVFSLVLQQAGFCLDLGQIDISRYINQLNNSSGPQNFRPLLLRFFSYQPLTDNFQILLDKGSLKKIEDGQIKAQGQELLKYFLVGVALADKDFWVNLRPDKEDQIIDRELARESMQILVENGKFPRIGLS